jgi:hypothetical protein
MNLKTIATTTLLIGLGLTQPLSAQTIVNAEQTVASAKPIKFGLSNSSLPSPQTKQLYIQIGIQPFYYSPVYWSWGLFFGNYLYNDFYSPYSYYNPYSLGSRYGYYGDRYYGNRYRRGYDYYSPAQIRAIYLQVLGREPDYRGLNTWLGQSRRASLYDIRRNIARSDEAVARINQIYREVLGRNADRDGIRTWTNRLASGASIYDVRRDIENSPEALSLRNRNYPRYSPNYVQPRRNIQPSTINPRLRDYSVPVRNVPTDRRPTERFPNRNLPRNTAPAVRSPNRNLPPATLSPSNDRPLRRYSPPENYQQPTRSRRNTPSRSNVPSSDYLLPERRNSGSTFSPSIPRSTPRIQR